MARIDKSLVSFRGIVTANLTGVWGDSTTPNLINVAKDSNGKLVAAGESTAEGVIDTTEGKASSDVANYNVALAGDVYTVHVIAQIVECNDLAAGETIWSVASGDIATAAATTEQIIGNVYAGDNGVDRVFLNVSGTAN